MRDKIKTLIAEGKTQQALVELLTYSQQFGNKKLQQKIISQYSNFQNSSQLNTAILALDFN